MSRVSPLLSGRQLHLLVIACESVFVAKRTFFFWYLSILKTALYVNL